MLGCWDSLGSEGAAKAKGIGLPGLGRAPEIVAGLDAGLPSFVRWRCRDQISGRFSRLMSHARR